MLKGMQQVNEWLGQITDMAKTLVVIGIVVGILFDDYFGVIAGLGRIMSQFGDAGFAGILSLAILVMWYEKNRLKLKNDRAPHTGRFYFILV